MRNIGTLLPVREVSDAFLSKSRRWEFISQFSSGKRYRSLQVTSISTYRIILNQHLDLHVEMEAWLGEGGVTDNFVSDIANFIF